MRKDDFHEQFYGRLEGNVTTFYGLNPLVRSMAFTVPVIMPLLNASGMSNGGVMYLQAGYVLALTLLQMPAGVTADRWGRKLSMMIGASFCAVGVLVYARSCSILGFVLAEIVLAFGFGFISGADTALLKGSLEGVGRGDSYRAIRGRIQAFGQVLQGGIIFLGGLFALHGERMPFYAACGGYCLTFVVITRLFEVPPDQGDGSAKPRILPVVWKCFRENRKVVWLSAIQALLLSFTLVGFWYSVPLFREYGIPKEQFAYWLGGLSLIVAAVFLSADRLYRLLGKYSYWLLYLSAAGGFMAAGSNNFWLAIVGLSLQRLTMGFGMVLFEDRLHNETPPEIRATVQSAAHMMMNATQVVVLIGSGLLIDATNASSAFEMGGWVLLFGGLVLMLLKPAKRLD